jgi:hypothetical protein
MASQNKLAWSSEALLMLLETYLSQSLLDA